MFPDVAEKINRPFEVKLAETRAIIEHHFEEFGDHASVAFSGGKDSQLVLYFCRQLSPSVPVVFNNTGVEYSSTRAFVEQLRREWNLDLTITSPARSFWECVSRYGFPTYSDKKRCCYWLKEKPMHQAIKQNGWLGVYDGVTAAESRQRQFIASQKGVCYHYVHWGICKIHPIMWWTENEVFEFLAAEGVRIHPVYATGQRRVGCLPCTAHKAWEPQLQRLNPKLYRVVKLKKDQQYVMEGIHE